jgi:phosphopantothenoylcysteine decarboxylase/phosphopantothenate--cysteine ligase
MKIVITTGPSYEPVDEVRRLTNFSTGELGVMLARTFQTAGHEIVLLRGEAATFPCNLTGIRVLPFATNQNLLQGMQRLSDEGGIGAVFHAAALCDFEVFSVQDTDGAELIGAKLSSRSGELLLRLRPAAKVINQLRGLFPEARIFGWKYEMSGTRDEALDKGRRQIEENRTEACVVNGRAFGPGFGLLRNNGKLTFAEDKEELCRQLVAELEGKT